MTTKNAHFPPSSRLIDATAATQGVYNRQNTRSAAAPAAVIVPRSASVVPNYTVSVETTLSFAINPVTSAVDIRQSPNPSGAKTGERAPAIIAKILSFESVTIFRLVSKLCKNQITIVAAKITVKAL